MTSVFGRAGTRRREGGRGIVGTHSDKAAAEQSIPSRPDMGGATVHSITKST